ncbi:MAG: serine/threonine-protein phosphatase [Bacteroidetes bacterium]|nr:serine/threonine-protein phosphatase [Bacteroidota bacterium]
MNVGGDYYDFIRLDEHRIAVGLGDVSGHGLSSALVMVNLQVTIRSQASFDPDPARCLERANRLLYRSTDSHTFVSLFYGILDTKRHSLTYANAGQNWPIVFSSARVPHMLLRHGLVLGVREDSAYEEEEIGINAGDFLLLFSDGVTEAMNEKREQFGDEKLIDTVRNATSLSGQSAIDEIIHAVNAHAGKVSQANDMTVVVVERK